MTASGRAAIDRIRRLRGVTWEWRDDVPPEVKERPGAGVIAQDVQKVFPDLVENDPARGHLRVDYAGLIAPLVEAVKELDDRLQEVEGAAASGGSADKDSVAQLDYAALLDPLIDAVKDLDDRVRAVKSGSPEEAAGSVAEQRDYTVLTAPLIEAVKELDDLLRPLEERYGLT